MRITFHPTLAQFYHPGLRPAGKRKGGGAPGARPEAPPSYHAEIAEVVKE